MNTTQRPSLWTDFDEWLLDQALAAQRAQETAPRFSAARRAARRRAKVLDHAMALGLEFRAARESKGGDHGQV